MSARRLYVFLNMPVGAKPYVDKIYKSNPYLDSIFERVKGNFILKRDLERLGIIFPAGPRYLMLPAEEFPAPTGPDIFDIATERYIKEVTQSKYN